MSIDWKAKLSSRKLWIGLALVVIGAVLCITGDIENGLRVITIGGVGYLGVECIVDVARAIWPSEDETEDVVVNYCEVTEEDVQEAMEQESVAVEVEETEDKEEK